MARRKNSDSTTNTTAVRRKSTTARRRATRTTTSGTTASSRPASSFTDEQIRERAYYIYLERRGAAGDPLRDWLQAEHELNGSSRG